MKRTTVGLNCQTFNASQLGQLTPLGYFEVAAGETVQGQLKSRLFSDTTSKPILNRAYYDTFAFYVPFRLLWDQFPEYISDPDSGLTVPTVTETFAFNFERYLAIGATPAALGTANNAWYRRAYNLVWNTYFRNKGSAEVGLDAVARHNVSLRPSTYHEAISNTAEFTDTDISTLTTVSEYRQAFAQDRFRQMRSLYGKRYTDFLGAIGVEASWSILDDPEPIGKNHADLPYKITNATTTLDGTNVTETGVIGQPAGYWDGVNTLNIRKTFCPEHGLICVFGAMKMDTVNRSGNGSPTLAKSSREEYWSPEFEAENPGLANYGVLGAGDPTPGDGQNGYVEKYSDYHRAHHQIAGPGGEVAAQGYYHSWNDASPNPENYRINGWQQFGDIFQGVMYNGAEQFQVTQAFALRKSTPVKISRPQVY